MELRLPRTRPAARQVTQRLTRVPRPFARTESGTAIQTAIEVLAAEQAPGIAGYVLRTGPRFRSNFCLVGNALVRERTGAPAAAGVAEFAGAFELLHKFQTAHDDIADRTESRRGEPSLHVMLRPAPSVRLLERERQRVGEQLAIVAGDALYTAAMQRMLSIEGVSPARVVAAVGGVLSTCRTTASGQSEDIAFSARPLADMRPEDVLEIYRRKISCDMFEAPLVAGATLAGADDAELAALKRFSHHTGLAYQLTEHLLALFARDEETGTPNVVDLREAKKTYPIVAASKRASPDERAWLEELFVRGDASLRDLVTARLLVRRTGALESSLALVESSCGAALEALADLPAGAARAELEGFVHWVASRAEAVR